MKIINSGYLSGENERGILKKDLGDINTNLIYMKSVKEYLSMICGIILVFQIKVQAQEMVPLNVDLPQPMFIGTPQDFNVPNLEKPLGKPRPLIMVPTGTANVALHKYVESSDNNPIIGDLELITDGDKEALDGSFVELASGKQYIMIDLEAKYTLYAIFVWHYHLEARVYKDVIVQVSDDPDFIVGVTTVFNNDHDNSYGLGVGEDLHYVETHEGKLIDARGVEARYVRLYSNGNSYDQVNHYIEVAVYGKPIRQ